eukprot:gene26495-32019_t
MDRFVIKPATNGRSLSDYVCKIKEAKQQNDVGLPQSVDSVDRNKRSKIASSSSKLVAKSEPIVSSSVQSVLSSVNVSVADEWKQRTANVFSSLDIACQRRQAQLQARSSTGWKVDSSGAKVYSTFRSGQRVTAGGKEGYKLAMGDGKTKGQKRKANELEDNVAVT